MQQFLLHYVRVEKPLKTQAVVGKKTHTRTMQCFPSGKINISNNYKVFPTRALHFCTAQVLTEQCNIYIWKKGWDFL